MFITGGKETRQWKAHTVMHQAFSSGNEFLQKSKLRQKKMMIILMKCFNHTNKLASLEATLVRNYDLLTYLLTY